MKKILIVFTAVMTLFLSGCSDASDYSKYLAFEKKQLEEVRKTLDSEGAGVVGWQTAYSNEACIVFSNHLYMLYYDKNKKAVTQAVNLKDLGANYIQGDLITLFKFSPAGDAVMICNGDGASEPGKSSNVYICDFEKHKIRAIAVKNGFKVLSDWSDNGLYFVMSDIAGNQITLYDRKIRKLREIPVTIGAIGNVFVSDSGNLMASLADGGKSYLLFKDMSYKPVEVPGNGIAIGFFKDQALYFEQGNLKGSDGSKSEVVYYFGNAPVTLAGNNNIFIQPSLKEGTLIYRVDDQKILHYNADFAQYQVVSFAPDLSRCLVADQDYLKFMVLSKDGNVVVLDPLNPLARLDGGEYMYHWYNNSTLFKLINRDQLSAGSLSITGYDMDKKDLLTIYEQ